MRMHKVLSASLEELKEKEQRKVEEKESKDAKKKERLQKKQEREEKRQQDMEKKRSRAEGKKGVKERKQKDVEDEMKGLRIAGDCGHGETEEDEDAVCPICGKRYSSDDTVNGLWVCCDSCEQWYDLPCTNIRNKRRLPKSYICEDCL